MPLERYDYAAKATERERRLHESRATDHNPDMQDLEHRISTDPDLEAQLSPSQRIALGFHRQAEESRQWLTDNPTD